MACFNFFFFFGRAGLKPISQMEKSGLRGREKTRPTSQQEPYRGQQRSESAVSAPHLLVWGQSNSLCSQYTKLLNFLAGPPAFGEELYSGGQWSFLIMLLELSSLGLSWTLHARQSRLDADSPHETITIVVTESRQPHR